jgi:HAD superfamily hydrolase (TIGR01509 family)
MPTLQAILWDVDGTLAETERHGHRVAFNQAFAACGLPWHWDEARYGELLQVAGGRERLLHDMDSRSDAPASLAERTALAVRLHKLKNDCYARLAEQGGIPLRPGVLELMRECRAAGITMAIATTSSRANVGALLHGHLGVDWPGWFGSVVCGEDVGCKKPDPEVYLLALEQLQCAPRNALAIEDSPLGAAAARAAGVAVIITRSSYFEAGHIEGALATGPGLDERAGWEPPVPGPALTRRVGLAALRAWHALPVFRTRPQLQTEL